VTLPPEHAVEPWSEAAARWRRASLPFAIPESSVFQGGNSNDAWLSDDEVVRVCWRADRGRLVREAQLLAELPSLVPHADVMAFGSDGHLSWVVSPRLPGTTMLNLLPHLTEVEVRDLFRQLAEVLRALHDWTPPEPLAQLLAHRPELDLALPASVWQADLVPLPTSRITAVAEVATAVPFVDSGLIEAALQRINSLERYDPFANETVLRSVIHGDATVANVLVHKGRISGLIDFEYARMGPPDLELLSPVLFGSGFGLPWLREDYPELFEGEHTRQRLWLYELCCALRGIIWWPPEQASIEHPPIATLRRLVDEPTAW